MQERQVNIVLQSVKLAIWQIFEGPPVARPAHTDFGRPAHTPPGISKASGTPGSGPGSTKR